ncbi:MAG: alkaline phosphatase D family protein [Gemmatimonadota bacterium]|jgi:alkaline phosphatase D
MTTRRDFLSHLSRTAFLASAAPNAWRLEWRPRFADDPFALGVASGDPRPDGVVLWTRLAPRPLEPEGGMDGRRTPVTWELAADEQFARIVQQGRVTAVPELGYSVHVDVPGLEPDRWYWYRFQTGEAKSPVGRARTTPAGDAARPLAFAFASCQHFESGYYTAFRHLAAEELDLVAHLGDYIYEYAPQQGQPRRHATREIRALDDYRARYAQYKTDLDLQAAHARAPWLVTWDDHEVDNNYADEVGENGMESAEQVRTRRAAAYQAWWEHMPVRVPRAASWADLTIHRATPWGRTAHLWVLDTRQYRSDQPCNDGVKVPCATYGAAGDTMLGEAQERWLVEGMRASSAHWQVLAQQVMMAPFDFDPGPATRVSMDQWTGYPVARDRLLRACGQHAAGRTVVLTGDIHSHWTHEVRAGWDRPDRPVIGAEFVCSSISSGGDGEDQWREVPPAMAANPDCKYHSARRGYVRCEVSDREWVTRYRTVPYVSRPGAPVETSRTFRLERGRTGLQPG